MKTSFNKPAPDLSGFADAEADPQESTPETGGTVVCTDDNRDRTLYLTPAGTLATLTITLPSNGNSRIGQIQRIVTTETLTALTVDGASTILGNVTTLVAGASVSFKKIAANVWFKL